MENKSSAASIFELQLLTTVTFPQSYHL